MTAVEPGKEGFARAAARAVGNLHGEDFCDALLALLQQAVGFDTAMTFTLREEGAPAIHHDRLASEERAAFYGPWLAGVYLLMPSRNANGVWHARSAAPRLGSDLFRLG